MARLFAKNVELHLILLALLTGCSGNEKKDESIQQDPALYSMESQNQDSNDILFEDTPGAASEVSEVKKEEAPVVAAVESESMEAQSSAPPSPEEMSVYRVQKDNETLMMIAFKIYGDYDRWREIASLNQEMFDERFIIKKGMMLKFQLPESEFKWVPKGEPFLIKWGDTLSSISHEVYSTFHRWKEIWHNNRPLIKNPNKIFAGFTVYYVPGKNAPKKMKKEALPDLASINPGHEEGQPVEAQAQVVDPKVELESLEEAPSNPESSAQVSEMNKDPVPAVDNSIDAAPQERNPTSL